MPMSRFVQKSFAVLFEVFLWIMAIAGVIFGFISMRNGFFLGLGIIIGTFILVVMAGGMMATFLDMAKNLRSIDEKTKQ